MTDKLQANLKDVQKAVVKVVPQTKKAALAVQAPKKVLHAQTVIISDDGEEAAEPVAKPAAAKPVKKSVSKAIAKNQQHILGGDDELDEEEANGNDPFSDVEMNSAASFENVDKELATMNAEEKDAFATPLNSKEMHKMEESGKSLLQEITSGL